LIKKIVSGKGILSEDDFENFLLERLDKRLISAKEYQA
jgi:hypothetical protein